jgi:hypothetical protein
MEELKGKRVRLVRMEDPYTNLKKGDLGTITGVDGLNQILVKWDNGSTLSLIPDVDEYEILEVERRIYSFQKFLEFVQEDSYIDAKLEELEDLVSSFTEGKDLMYEWENKNDHQVIITYQVNGDSTKFEMDLDSNSIVKTQNDKVVLQEEIDSVESALDMIEKEIQSDLGIYEGYSPQWDSSIEEDEANRIVYQMKKFQSNYNPSDQMDEQLVEVLKRQLRHYDEINMDFVIDALLFDDASDETAENIIRTGDIIMNKFGTEPQMVVNAFEDAFSVLSRYVNMWDDEDEVDEDEVDEDEVDNRIRHSAFERIEEKKKGGRTKSGRTKSGRKVPGKYLTKNRKAMKKEIEKYSGTDTYKKDWDADYKSGKGGEGKRYKTKKSAATKAYQKKYGNK